MRVADELLEESADALDTALWALREALTYERTPLTSEALEDPAKRAREVMAHKRDLAYAMDTLKRLSRSITGTLNENHTPKPPHMRRAA